MYTLKRSVFVDTTLERAWDFIRRPQNLNLITPDDMDFRILSEVTDDMHDGLLIKYKVRLPFLGARDWLTEIKHVRDRHSFVDEQRVGPYKLWYHYHEIRETPEGVLFIDEVTYEVPFSLIGRIAHALFIRRTLDRIFDFRNARFKELLGSESLAGLDVG